MQAFVSFKRQNCDNPDNFFPLSLCPLQGEPFQGEPLSASWRGG